MTVLEEEAPANYVPAAAVIRRGLALYCTMGASLMQQRRVSDEGLRVVKLCPQGR